MVPTPKETTFTARSLGETREFATRFVRALTEKEKYRATATIIALSGDLGAGKTTFVQQCAAILGIDEYVTSPTFVLQQIYKLPQQAPWKHLVHIDAYRLEGGADMEALQWSSYATDPGNIIFIEWPTQVPGAVPQRAYWIDIEEKEEEQSETRIFSYPDVLHLA